MGGATAYKEAHEVKMKAKEAEAAALTGKDNAKARKEATKAASDMKKDDKYIDALKVLKDLVPPKGNFMTRQKQEPEGVAVAPSVAAAPVKEEKKKEPSDKKPPKKQESTGLSKAEKEELEKLKTDLIARKTELKAQGLSGGACNKDEQVVQWVARMQELKIKEDPSLAVAKPETKKKEKVKSRESSELEAQIEEYKEKLKSEFGYSKKEIL